MGSASPTLYHRGRTRRCWLLPRHYLPTYPWRSPPRSRGLLILISTLKTLVVSRSGQCSPLDVYTVDAEYNFCFAGNFQLLGRQIHLPHGRIIFVGLRNITLFLFISPNEFSWLIKPHCRSDRHMEPSKSPTNRSFSSTSANSGDSFVHNDLLISFR